MSSPTEQKPFGNEPDLNEGGCCCPPSSLRQAEYWFRYPVDRFGDPIHIAFACLFAFSIALPISFTEIIFGALLACWGVRLPFLWRVHRLQLRQWPILLLLAFVLWQALTLFNTEHRWAGFEQWGALRYSAAALALYPIARYRGLVLLSLAAGFVLLNLGQFLILIAPQLAGHWALRAPSVDGRIGGWWPVVVAGELLVAMLAVHLGALRHASTWPARALGVGGAILSCGGILLTGTRGAWIAALTLLAIWACVMLAARVRVRAPAVLLALSLGLAACVMAFAVSPSIRQRITDARNEVTRMVVRGEYQTNIGLRIKMFQWGVAAFLEQPLTGIGPGDFRSWVLERAGDAQPNERAAIELFERERHTHPHNSPLGVMVSSGVPAGLLLLAVTIASGVAAWRRGASGASGPDVVRAYAAGPGWIILAMTLLWPFDVVTQSVQPAAMLMLGIALAPGWLPWRPGDAPKPPGPGG